MTKFDENKETGNGAERAGDIASAPIPHMDRLLLIKRINALMDHISNVDGAEGAESKAREITTHLKNLKEIDTHNKAIKADQDKKAYTRYEDLPAPRPEDIEAYRRRLEGIIARFAEPDTAKGS